MKALRPQRTNLRVTGKDQKWSIMGGKILWIGSFLSPVLWPSEYPTTHDYSFLAKNVWNARGLSLTLTVWRSFGDSWEGSVPADARRVRPLDIIYKSHSFVKS